MTKIRTGCICLKCDKDNYYTLQLGNSLHYACPTCKDRGVIEPVPEDFDLWEMQEVMTGVSSTRRGVL